MTPFTCTTREAPDGTIVIAAAGELDIATTRELVSAATPWLLLGVHLVLDCSGITFMDSRGMRALMELRRLANRGGAQFALSAVPRQVSRILTLTGTRHLFALEVLTG